MSRNYARFYILLNRLPTEDKDELKASLVNQYTGGRTESLREMTVNEYDAMCEDMQRMDENYKAREIYRERLRQKRSTALKLMQSRALTRPTGTGWMPTARIPGLRARSLPG